MSSSNKDYKNVSVVIATLGEPTLRQTISSLNSGTLRPMEILICIPKGVDAKLNINEFDNVQIIICPSYGQVLQRIEGFKRAKYELVMQIDSDIDLHVDCLENLVKAMDSLPEKSCISPFPDVINREIRGNFFFESLLTRKSASRKKNNSEGKIKWSCRTSNPYIAKLENLSKTEWVNGIVMHRKENLILNNYYPFVGKAYYEDVIHSIFMSKLGIGIWVCQNAKIKYLDELLSEYATIYECSEYFSRLVLIRWHILKINGGSAFLMLITLAFEYFFAIIKVFFLSKYMRSIKKISLLEKM